MPADVDPRWLSNAVAAVRALEGIVGTRDNYIVAYGPPRYIPDVPIELRIHVPDGRTGAHAEALRAALAEKAEEGRNMNQGDRYEIAGDVVRDHHTGLEWQAQPHPRTMAWQEAMDHAASIGDDWRLPTIQELITLIDFSRCDPASAFPGMPSRWFWSSSSYVGSASYAWGVYFDGGGLVGSNDKTSMLYVRCVRRRRGWGLGSSDLSADTPPAEKPDPIPVWCQSCACVGVGAERRHAEPCCSCRWDDRAQRPTRYAEETCNATPPPDKRREKDCHRCYRSRINGGGCHGDTPSPYCDFWSNEDTPGSPPPRRRPPSIEHGTAHQRIDALADAVKAMGKPPDKKTCGTCGHTGDGDESCVWSVPGGPLWHDCRGWRKREE